MELASTVLCAKTLKLMHSSDRVPFPGLFIFMLVALTTKEREDQGPLLMPKFKCSPSSSAGP